MLKHLSDCLLAIVLWSIVSPSLLLSQESASEATVLRTVAEHTDYQATSRYDDVMHFCSRLASTSSLVHLDSMGVSQEGRSLPLLVIADPPIATAEEARQGKRLVVLAIANIHAGEVCGKEALLMLARDLVAEEHPALLRNMILLLAPIYNADGNERASTRNRPRQNGPAEGVGQRENAQGLDLNRDFMKLEASETRALTRLMTRWDPAIFLDLHATNGSHHRYGLTYDSPRHPATDAALASWTRDTFLDDVSQRLEADTGYRSFFYGNFDRQREKWETYPAQARFGTHYSGLRNQVGILSEAYAYASFRDRVQATYGFVKQCLTAADAHRAKIAELRQAAVAAAQAPPNPEQPDLVPLRWNVAAWKEVDIPGFEEEAVEGGRPRPTSQPRDYTCMYYGATEPTLSVARPFAYLVPAKHQAVIDNLLLHGVDIEILREDLELDIQRYRVAKVNRSRRAYQGHELLDLEAEVADAAAMVPAGTAIVKTTQALGRLVVQLLEPQSPDGLAAWNFLDSAMEEGGEFPILRLPLESPMLTSPWRLPREGPKEPLTYERIYGRNTARLAGAPLSGFRWDDDEHYLLTRNSRLWRVNARTGRGEPLEIDSSKVAAALAKLPEIGSGDARRLAQGVFGRSSGQRLEVVLNHDGELYFVKLDGSHAVRLTNVAGQEELADLSPDGQHVAFVREFDMYVVDVATQTEKRLTEGGSSILRRGKADWVYFEEIYHRNWKAFKWSPDSRRIAFQEFDDSGVENFTVLNHLRIEQGVEVDRYPLAGQTNPNVRLGLTGVDGEEALRWIDFGDAYPAEQTLITRFQWVPDSNRLLVYLQDRAQRWLDVVSVDAETCQTRLLFRDSTQAWVEDPGDVRHLDDSSFLIFSERDGWRRLYRYSDSGELLGPITQGPWEVRSIEHLDQEQQAIWVRGTRDASLAQNLYRIDMRSGEVQRLTAADGDHSVRLNPSATMFIDTNSSRRAPEQVTLRDGDGQIVRTLDINPVPDLDQYTLGKLEFVRIPARDGFELDASLVFPPDFDPSRKYPVWLMTYAGPNAPTLSDSWGRGRGMEQLLANMGIIAFRMDPRSASGKGAISTWAAYRQLGVPELQDIEDAVKWLHQHEYVDADRIGMSGHSYGGFMTAYAMTHSKLFAAGIAGAPVTDWRNYDTIYTERYMDTPQNNPDGYRKTSVVEAAKDLHGRLLLIHGARDDNVHLANTLQLVHALQQADRDFELMIYPNSRHGIGGSHYQRLMIDFIRRTMLADEK